MKRFLLLFLALPVFAAPSTPITRGRLTTDLDAAGHTVTNSNLATTNFVWEVVGAVTNNLPTGGGITTNDVEGIIEEVVPGQISTAISEAVLYVAQEFVQNVEMPAYLAPYAVRTNLPPLSASATVGDLVDRVDAVIGALR